MTTRGHEAGQKLRARDAARVKAEALVELMRHAVENVLTTDNERRAFLQAVKRSAAGLYQTYRSSEPLERPPNCEPIKGVRDNAFVLTRKHGEVHVTHSRTWIRLKTFDCDEAAIAWAVDYWTAISPEQRKRWIALSWEEVVKLVFREIEGC